jgi:hypothetical protein
MERASTPTKQKHRQRTPHPPRLQAPRHEGRWPAPHAPVPRHKQHTDRSTRHTCRHTRGNTPTQGMRCAHTEKHKNASHAHDGKRGGKERRPRLCNVPPAVPAGAPPPCTQKALTGSSTSHDFFSASMLSCQMVSRHTSKPPTPQLRVRLHFTGDAATADPVRDHTNTHTRTHKHTHARAHTHTLTHTHQLTGAPVRCARNTSNSQHRPDTAIPTPICDTTLSTPLHLRWLAQGL